MRKKELQISLFDTYSEMLDLMEENKPELIKLIDECIDFEAIMPPQFCMRYYTRPGRKRTNPLSSYISVYSITLTKRKAQKFGLKKC